MPIENENLSYSDGLIVEYRRNNNCVELIFKDWREKNFSLKFTDILVVYDSGSIGVDIEKLEIQDCSNILPDNDCYFIASLLKEDLSTYKNFKFVDSWDSRCVLAIIAKELSISRNP